LMAAASAGTAMVAMAVIRSGAVAPLVVPAGLTAAVHTLLYALAGRTYPTGSRTTCVGAVAALGAVPTTRRSIRVEGLPDLEEEDVRQALGYAAALARDEVHSLHT
jgi:hypothetical protein